MGEDRGYLKAMPRHKNINLQRFKYDATTGVFTNLKSGVVFDAMKDKEEQYTTTVKAVAGKQSQKWKVVYKDVADKI
jgi:hypothetical protein